MHKNKNMLKSVQIDTQHFFEEAYLTSTISEERKKILHEIAAFISEKIAQNEPVNLNYICTHNSRRSQLAQVWSSYATTFFNLPTIRSFSGGTSATSFNRNTVKTLQEAGFNFQILEFSHQNPVYLITYKNCKKPIVGYSKRYDCQKNDKPFIAITTCAKAAQNCPFIVDAVKRFHLPFNDPEKFDSNSQMLENYLKINTQIAREIYTVFKQIKSSF